MRAAASAAPPRRHRSRVLSVSLLVLVGLLAPTLVVFSFMHSLPDSRGGEFKTHDGRKRAFRGASGDDGSAALGLRGGARPKPLFGGQGIIDHAAHARSQKEQQQQQQQQGTQRGTAGHELDGAIMRGAGRRPIHANNGSRAVGGQEGSSQRDGLHPTAQEAASAGGDATGRPISPPLMGVQHWRGQAGVPKTKSPGGRQHEQQVAEARQQQARVQDKLEGQQARHDAAQRAQHDQQAQQEGPRWPSTLLQGSGKTLPRPSCRDTQAAKDCQAWAASGECDSRPGYMYASCAATCGLCQTVYLHGAEVAQQVELVPGVMMPMVGVGTAGMADLTADAVFTAIRVGYRLVDSAGAREWYREDLVGWGWSASGIKREHLFITSKIHPRHHGYWSVLDVFSEALQDLQTDYVDLMLLHYPDCWGELCGDTKPEGTWQDSWAALEQLVAEKKLRAAGVSNFNVDQMRELVRIAKVKPALLQANSDLLHQNWELQAFCRRQGIQFQAYSSLGGQWLTQVQGAYNPVLDHPVLTQIAAKHQKTPAQTVLRWALQHGQAVVPRTTKVNRLEENLALFEFDLSDEEMQLLDALDGTQPVPPGQQAQRAQQAAQAAVAAAQQAAAQAAAGGDQQAQHAEQQAAQQGQAANAAQQAAAQAQQAQQEVDDQQQAHGHVAAQRANAAQQAAAQEVQAQEHVEVQRQAGHQAAAQRANAAQLAQAQHVLRQQAADGAAAAQQRRRLSTRAP